LLFRIIVAKNRLGLGNFLGFNFRDFTFFPVSWKTSDVRIQKNQALFLGCAEQLRAASQYTVLSHASIANFPNLDLMCFFEKFRLF